MLFYRRWKDQSSFNSGLYCFSGNPFGGFFPADVYYGDGVGDNSDLAFGCEGKRRQEGFFLSKSFSDCAGGGIDPLLLHCVYSFYQCRIWCVLADSEGLEEFWKTVSDDVIGCRLFDSDFSGYAEAYIQKCSWNGGYE